jgi:putative PIN family toxin of toxin-antitoxin system
VSPRGAVRAVLDPNVLVSGVLSPQGAPARTMLAWRRGEFELVVSPLLLEELRRVLAYPKVASRLDPTDAAELVALVEEQATCVADPSERPRAVPEDPDDDYLVALAAAAGAVLVSGDAHLLALAGRLPVCSPRAFLELLATD